MKLLEFVLYNLPQHRKLAANAWRYSISVTDMTPLVFRLVVVVVGHKCDSEGTIVVSITIPTIPSYQLGHSEEETDQNGLKHHDELFLTL